MKSALYKKNSKLGAVVGHLCAPNKLQYEQCGKVEMLILTGNVVDTEGYDVLVLGTKEDDGTFHVQKMESMPKESDGVGKFKATDGEEEILAMLIPMGLVTDIQEKVNDKGTRYHALVIPEGKRQRMHLSVLGEFNRSPVTGCYAFLLTGRPEVRENQFGEGYAVAVQVSRYAAGIQLLS